ncbi:MAG: hypothetical protein GX025_10590 [Clostridiales bacterium]|nr:hypothetical protein [Clostridiales bacterium]
MKNDMPIIMAFYVEGDKSEIKVVLEAENSGHDFTFSFEADEYLAIADLAELISTPIESITILHALSDVNFVNDELDFDTSAEYVHIETDIGGFEVSQFLAVARHIVRDIIFSPTEPPIFILLDSRVPEFIRGEVISHTATPEQLGALQFQFAADPASVDVTLNTETNILKVNDAEYYLKITPLGDSYGFTDKRR